MSEAEEEQVTAGSLAGLLETVVDTPQEAVVVELARCTIRGRRALSQLARLAEVAGRRIFEKLERSEQGIARQLEELEQIARDAGIDEAVE